MDNMQIFELHFNPKNKQGRLIDTFCYQPGDVYEKRLGTLAIAGELNVKSSKKKTVLNNLAYKIKSTYHSLPTRSQEEALREGLTQGNEFLSDKSVDEQLNVAVLSVKGKELQFSAIGKIKILLSRNGEITDIGQNADGNAESFGSIVTGKVKKEDKLIILTEDIYEHFVNQGLLIELAEKSPINEKKLNKISETQEEKFPKAAGICLIMDFSVETIPENEKIINKNKFSFKKTFLNFAEESQKILSFVMERIKVGAKKTFFFLKENIGPAFKKFGKLLLAVIKDLKKGISSFFGFLLKKVKKGKNSLKESFNKKREAKNKKKEEGNSEKKDFQEVETEETPIKKSTKKISFFLRGGKKEFSKLKKKIKRLPKKEWFPEIPKFKMPKNEKERRNIYLAGLLFLIILTGSLVTHFERQRQIEEQKVQLSEISERLNQINMDSEEAFSQLLAHYENLDNLITEGMVLESNAEILQNEVVAKLLQITDAEIVEEPKVVSEANEVTPSKLEFAQNELYLYNPFLSNVEKYNPETEETLIRPVDFENNGIFSMTSIEEEVFFFSRPNKIIALNESQRTELLTSPYENYSFQQMDSFEDYLYLLEGQNNQIIRYHKDGLQDPTVWIRERKPGQIISFAVDETIWMLKENNKIWQYESNVPNTDSLIELKEIFPLPERFTKIKTGTNLPLFILEPRNNRIIISSKEGELIKQIIIPQANNLKDFVITEEIKIYLLDDQKVYSLDVDI